MQCTESKIMPISLCEKALKAPQIDHKIRPYTEKLRQLEWKTTSPQTNQGNQTAQRSHQFCLYTWSWPGVTKVSKIEDNKQDKSNSNLMFTDDICFYLLTTW